MDLMRLRVFTEPQQGARYETQLRVARAAEDLGFDGFFRSDHYLKFGDASGLPGPTDAWLTLAGLARETSRIRLGTMAAGGRNSASALAGTRPSTPPIPSRSPTWASDSPGTRSNSA
jgi:alkanesulfonate monooxygenase SsuD/methylene tetrahydromethanopterin reductase-like flavin-dependent oxidoreductase (luciferase family)